MKAEQVILSFFAVIIGLIVAGAAFYIYESTRVVQPSSVKTISIKAPTPTPASSLPLSIETPIDNAVVTSKIVTFSGKTDPQATVIVSTSDNDTVVSPSSVGSFSLTLTLPSNENEITITAVGPSGNETQKTITVSVAPDNF